MRDTELGFSKMAGENKGKMVKRQNGRRVTVTRKPGWPS